MTGHPFVSVIIVNYNGKHFLSACLDGLRMQTYPENSFEILVSDNASTDGSVELLRESFPWVRLIENESNLGFASGNNVAINSSQGEYLVLLNNDTVPKPDWLENLVRAAEGNPQAGIVTGRLVLFYDQIKLELRSEPFSPPGDGRELGVQLYSIDTGLPYGVTQYIDGFYGYEPSAFGKPFRWTKSDALLGIPVPPGLGSWTIDLTIAAYRPGDQPVAFQLFLDGDDPDRKIPVFSGSITGSKPFELKLEIPASSRHSSTPVLQNTGSVIFCDGASRDRGTYVRDTEVLYEADVGQYDCIEEVFSGCGANMLLKREMLDGVGLFDDNFFMYYEDTDLSWRCRLAGWKVLYAPDAIVRHIHCGTSKEWSPFFLFLVERNRLAMVVKNGQYQQIIWTLSRYLARTGLNSFAAMRALVFGRENRQLVFRWPRHHARVILAFMGWIPSLIRKRKRIQKTRVISPSSLMNWFLDKT